MTGYSGVLGITFAAAALMLLAATPSRAETVAVEGVFAAGAREASLLRTIGVGRFEGVDGDDVAIAIEQQLAQLGADGVPHPRLIAPSLRPAGLLTGRTDIAVTDDPYTESRQRCVEKDKDRKCVKRESYRVRCLRRTVRLRVDLAMEADRDRPPVYSALKSREDFDSGCEDGGIVTSVDTTLRSMIEGIAREVRLDLAPHRASYAIRVREKRDGLSPADAARFKAAVRLTKRDQTAACAAFAALGATVADHGPTLFNRALCAEAAGRYAEAGDLYFRARVFGDGFGGEISKGLARVAALQAGREDVQRIAALQLPGAFTPR